MPPHTSLDFAPPEVVAAYEDAQPCLVRASHDMWSLGALAFAYIAQEGAEHGCMFAAPDSAVRIFECAQQRRRYPWEHKRTGAAHTWHASGVADVFEGCLERSASLRPSAREVLGRIDAFLQQKGAGSFGV